MNMIKKAILLIILTSILSGVFASNTKFNKSIITFSTDVFQKLAYPENKNVFISPVSIYLALAMTYNGASGNTKKAIEVCLKSGNISREELNQFGKQFLQLMNGLKKDVTITLANSLWIKSSFEVLDAFININRNSFDAEIKRIAMKPEDRNLINRWIEEKTNNKIKNMLKRLNSASIMFLINAIYFLGNWENQFNVRLTRENIFRLADGNKMKIKMMTKPGSYPYYETEDFQAVRLDYKGKKLGMVVVLPKEGKTLSGLLKKFSVQGYTDIVENLSIQAGNVFLPKFKFKYSENLITVMKRMGMGIAFTGKADFRGINPGGGLLINLFQHDAFIEVNETGTEAAAATIIGIARTSNGSRRFVFKADRPFFYFIMDNERHIPLFMGTLYQPES